MSQEQRNDNGTFDIDMENGYLILEDEEGNKAKFIIEDDIEVDEKRYLILCHEDEVELGEFVALRIDTDENGDEFLATIEDEAELARIQEYLDESFEYEESDEE